MLPLFIFLLLILSPLLVSAQQVEESTILRPNYLYDVMPRDIRNYFIEYSFGLDNENDKRAVWHFKKLTSHSGAPVQNPSANLSILLYLFCSDRTHIIDINAFTDTSFPALNNACSNNNFELFKLLLACKNIKLDHKDSTGNTIFHVVAQWNGIDFLKLLLSHANTHIHINEKNNRGLSPLHKATQSNDLAIMEEFLKIPTINVNIQNSQGNTPLHCANPHAALLLLNHHSINVAIKNIWDQVPLHTMLQKEGNYELPLKLILGLGIDVNIPDMWGKTPFYYAILFDKISTIQPLLDHPDININQRDCANRSTLNACLEIYSNSASRIQFLLTLPKIDVNECTQGNPLLHEAIKKNNSSVLKMLLDHPSIDVHKKNSYGLTPLGYALQISQFESFKIMLDHPKICHRMIQAVDCQGNTLLHTAASDNNVQLIKMLLTLTDLDANAKNYYGCTAVELTWVPVIKNLLRETMKNQQRIRKK